MVAGAQGRIKCLRQNTAWSNEWFFPLLSNVGQTPLTLHPRPGSLDFKEAPAIRITEMY